MCEARRYGTSYKITTTRKYTRKSSEFAGCDEKSNEIKEDKLDKILEILNDEIDYDILNDKTTTEPLKKLKLLQIKIRSFIEKVIVKKNEAEINKKICIVNQYSRARPISNSTSRY